MTFWVLLAKELYNSDMCTLLKAGYGILETSPKHYRFSRDPAGARTQDPDIKSVVLYQLSYEAIKSVLNRYCRVLRTIFQIHLITSTTIEVFQFQHWAVQVEFSSVWSVLF